MSHQRFVLILAISLAKLTTSSFSQTDKTENRTPLVTLAGSKSKIVKRKVVRIHSGDEWKALWREHRTGSAKMNQDFEESESTEFNFRDVMLIAIFDGEVTASSRYDTPTIIESEEQVRIRIPSNGNQTGPGPLSVSQPWCVLAIHRTNKEVILEQDSRGLLADPPKWTEWKKFPKLDPAK